MNHREVLEAVSAALADPHRLVDVLQAAADEEDARRRLGETFDLTKLQAQAVLDMQFRLLTAGRHAAVADELRAERTPQGSPLTLSATVSGRVASVTVDGRPLEGRGRTPAKAVEALATRLRDEIARQQHRPVVVQVAGVEGLDRFVATHSAIRFHWRDEAADEGP